MKTVNAVDARRGLGHLLNLVSVGNETIVIERAGVKLAMLKPYESGQETASDSSPEGQLNLLDLAGLGGEIWSGVDIDAYIQKERDQWA